MSKFDTIVVGGGIVGLSCAYYLARRGVKVLVIERDTIDSGASIGNAGLIAYGHAPMPRPGVIKQTLKMLLDPLNPLYVKPRVNLAMFKWFRDFRRACTHERFDESMSILTKMGWASKECFEQIVRDEMVNGEYRGVGWLDVCLTEPRLEQTLEEAELLRSYDYKVEALSGAEMREREPALRDEVIGGTHYHDGAIADPGRFVTELGDCLPEHGVTIKTNLEVKRIVLEGGRFIGVRTGGGETLKADRLVLAAGVWSTEIARTIGVEIPLQAGKGYHVNLTPPKQMPRLGMVCAETYVAVTPMSGKLRLAGTVEFSGINDTLVNRRLNMLAAGVRRYVRGIGTSQSLSTWCGLRPCTADGLPVVGASVKTEGVYFATGHAMMGLTLGPVTGKLISEMIVDGSPSMDVSLLSPDRFVRTR